MLANTYIVACQHILEPQMKMFELFVEFGIPKKNIFILGKAYSTSASVLADLQKGGFQVEQPIFQPKVSFDQQHAENCRMLFEKAKGAIANASKVVVLDDGAGVLTVFNERLDEIGLGTQIFGVEQTSSGFRRLEKVSLRFPVINVARSKLKLEEESVFIGINAVEKIEAVLTKLPSPKVLVIGLGPIGRAIADSLKRKGMLVEGFDVAHGHSDLVRKISDIKPSLIVGATGTPVLTKEDIAALAALGQMTYLVSLSSSDREFPVVPFRTGSQIHGDIVVQNVCFVNNGFPVSFKGNRSEITVEWIEPTIAQLLGSTLYCANQSDLIKDKGGFVPVPSPVIDALQ